jgi:hypothetical protein
VLDWAGVVRQNGLGVAMMVLIVGYMFVEVNEDRLTE